MQDELKKVISQAMDTSSSEEQEPIAQIAEGELTDEALEAVAGGVCVGWSFAKVCVAWTAVRNANQLA